MDVVSKLPKIRAVQHKAFTLIELLVVIAIIALLLAIIMPSLNLVKKKAAAAVCLVNTKNLSTAWFMYQESNNGRLVSPNTGENGWVGEPEKEYGGACYADSGEVTDADEIRGIEKGKLYPYLEDPDVYHCPADNQRTSKYDYGKIFRTYSIVAALDNRYTGRFLKIKTPGTKINFVEESEGRNFNVGGWEFYAANDPANGPDPYWRDPIGINHGSSGILGYCDGHAENHKWRDEDTIERVQYYFDNTSIQGYGNGGGQLNNVYKGGGLYDPTQTTDINYVNNAWAYRF